MLPKPSKNIFQIASPKVIIQLFSLNLLLIIWALLSYDGNFWPLGILVFNLFTLTALLTTIPEKGELEIHETEYLEIYLSQEDAGWKNESILNHAGEVMEAMGYELQHEMDEIATKA